MADITYKVELGLGSNWKTADGFAWTDETLDVRKESAISTHRGRSSEVDDFQPGRGTFAFNNPTRKYDPDYADGPLYGQLLNGIPVRISGVVNGGAAKPIIRGFLKGLPQRYMRGNTFAFVPVQIIDGMERISKAKLPQTVYDYYVGLNNPVAYWKCDDDSEASLADSSGNSHDGVWDNVTFDEDPLVADEGKAVAITHVGDSRGRVYDELISAFPYTIEAWVKFPRALAEFKVFAGTQRDQATLTMALCCFADSGSTPNPNGCLGFRSGTRRVQGDTTIDNDARHHVVAVVTDATTIALYVDSALQTLTTHEAGNASTLAANYLWGLGNTWDFTSGDFGIGGVIDNLAVYDSALTSDDVFLHWLAGNFSWGGDASGTRIGRILDIVGWPANLRDLETGDAILPIADPVFSGSALAYMKRVEQTEQGRLFVTKDGVIRFLNRYFWATEARSSTSQLTLADCDYRDVEIDHTSDFIVNHLTGSRTGGPKVEVADEASIEENGDQGDTLTDLMLSTDGQVRDLLLYRLGRYKDPQRRIGPVEISLDGVSNTMAEDLLDLELGDRITIQRTPQGIGDPIDVEVIVEAIDHRIAGNGWTMTLQLSPVDTGDFGLWGSGLWGTAIWAA